MVKGTSSGTVTAENGTYSLVVPSGGRILVFSFTDMETKEVVIGNQSFVNASLNTNTSSMESVVVVGYGVQQKKSFTGTSSHVDAKQFANLITPSVDKQLAGRAAGVQVTNSGGLVNTPARIRIRGTNSINGLLDPLYVVDGIPIITGNLAGATNSNAIGDINPNDIESMEVLKDGASTAMYGSRGANGVILITTKKGRNGQARVSYDVTFGYSSVLKDFDLLNATQFVTIANEKFTNAGLTPKAVADPTGVNTDWQKEVLLNNAPVQSHTLSISGGNNRTTYYMSLNFSKVQGVVISNKNRSYRARLNLDHEVNKFIKIGDYITLSRQEDYDQNNGSNSLGGAISSTLRLLPNVSPYSTTTPSGYNIVTPGNSMGLGSNLQSIDDNWFNVAFTLRNNQAYSDKYRIINNAFIEISPIKGLKLRSQASADFLNDASFTSWDPRHGDGGGSTNGLVDNYNSNRLRYVWQNYFNYNISIAGKHNIFVTGGHELQKTNTRFAEATGQNISDIFFVKENLITGTATIQSVAGNYSQEGFESLFGRLNYDYKNRYFVQGSIRRDGLSALAPDKRYGVFPGISAGWRISEEKFWKNGLFRVVNEAKLKASVAKVGNPLTGFPYLSTYSSYPYGNIGGIAQNNVGNTDLQWETSKKYDIGAEFSLLKNRFTLAFDWFKNDIDNLVLAVPTPPSAGVPFNSISQNIGNMENKGIELTVSANIIQGKQFNWSINANYSKVNNKVKSLYSVGGAPVPYIVNGSYNIIRVGDPINIIYGYQYAGVNASNGNPVYINAAGKYVQQSIPSGAYTIIDGKNSTTTGASSPLAFADKTNLGNPTPTWFGGVTNTVTYANLSLEVMMRYSGGNKIMNVTRQEALFSQSFHNNGTEILGRWTTAGQETMIPRLYYGQSANINQTGNAISRFVEKGDYLRLQNIVLSYSLDNKMMERFSNGYIHSFRFFVQGQNLYVWTKYKGADPDNISAAGIDAAVSPQVRTISLGLNVGF
jgi:TonB-linked SusC/RagA family outer membrane protein